MSMKKLEKIIEKNMKKQFKKMVNDNVNRFLKSKFTGLDSIVK